MDKIKKIIRFIARFINRIAVSAVKSIGFISFAITLLLILVIAGAFFADRHFAGGYYSGYLMQNSMGGGNDWFFEFSYFTETYPVWSVVLIAAFFLAVFALKFVLRKYLVKNTHKHNILTNTAYVCVSVVMNVAMLIAAVAVVYNGMIVSYIHSVTDNSEQANAGFWEKTDFIKRQIEENRSLSSMALQKIIFDMEKEPDYVSSMTEEEHKALCLEVNHLIDLQGGPRTAEEHYLRNRLNDAPATLNDMVSLIRSSEQAAWILMAPAQSAYHMLGQNGEFNLKFVSSDGFFEAVYDKNGALLTEDNDPVNMGTYNYADPVTEPQKHSTYDVLPYYEWGNTPDSGAASEDDLDIVLNAIARYEANAKAVSRYNAYKTLTGS